ncbi:MAG: imidazoleglycerol-phosphate dehydratase HisB [Halobacteriaceae archaeon]
MAERNAALSRETAETTIEITIDIDGEGNSTVDTGIPFVDHMLDSFATHGLFDLTVRANGDLDVDDHHTLEDIGIVLGSAFSEALGNRRGIQRFADSRVPLDEALSTITVDISGRPYFEFSGEFSQDRVGGITSDMARHFWRSFVFNAEVTAHVEIRGENTHHEVEALFKGFARTLDEATKIDDRRGIPSTKGELVNDG